jgi:putative ABC transport system permease protein
VDNPWGGESLTVAPFTTADGQLTFQVMGLPETSTLLIPRNTKGEAIPIDRVIITRALAEKLGLQVGDSLTITQTATAQDLALTVDAVAEMYVTAAVFMPQNRLNSVLGAPAGSFNALFSTARLDVPSQDVLMTMSMAESKAAFDSVIEPVWMVLGFIAVFAVFIALMALSVVTTLTVEEERHSISVLKVLGYHADELNAMVLGSGIIAVVAGFAISMPLLLSSWRSLFAKTTSTMTFSLPIRLSPLSVLVCFVIMLATYLVSLRAARRKVQSVGMAVSLKAARE